MYKNAFLQLKKLQKLPSTEIALLQKSPRARLPMASSDCERSPSQTLNENYGSVTGLRLHELEGRGLSRANILRRKGEKNQLFVILCGRLLRMAPYSFLW